MTIKTTQLKISEAEFKARADKLLEVVKAQKLGGVVLFDGDYLKYYSGFAFIPTVRPMAFVMNAAGERALFVPRLEAEHAKANSLVQRVDHYLEYPGDQHPMAILKQTLAIMGG